MKLPKLQRKKAKEDVISKLRLAASAFATSGNVVAMFVYAATKYNAAVLTLLSRPIAAVDIVFKKWKHAIKNPVTKVFHTKNPLSTSNTARKNVAHSVLWQRVRVVI